MYLKFFILFLALFSSKILVSAQDICYDIDLPVGQIGNCIPRDYCTSNITFPGACASYPDDFVCCFDDNLPGREMRGAWVASVANIDWPTTPSTNVTFHQNAIIHLINQLEKAGINAVYFQVRPVGDALYISNIEPWSRYLTGSQGLAPNPLWDPLEFMIEYAHEKNIEVHAWMNPYRVNMSPNFDGLDPKNMAITFREYAYIYGTHVWMDPGSEEVQNRTYDVAIDLTTRYDLDGIHMDDYFYPYPVAGVPFPDTATYNRYVAGGGSLSLEDWRRDNVNRLVERLNIGMHEVKPYIRFSISPFGIYRAGHPEGMPSPPITGFDQYTQLYADPKLWLQEGWVDQMIPQLYWRIAPPAQSYPILLDWWSGANTLNRHVYAGNFLSKILEDWQIPEFRDQIAISRERINRLRGSWGNVQFSAKVFRDDNFGAVDYFKTFIYPFPALQPVSPWLAQKAGKLTPNSPIYNLENGNELKISSDGIKSNDFNKVAVYKINEEGTVWNLVKIISEKMMINGNAIDLENGKYAISSVDRFGQESQKIYFKI